MSFAFSAGVRASPTPHKMLDVTGNNPTNVNTTAFKSSRVIFSELLSATIKKASQAGEPFGGTDSQKIGGIAGVADVSQGNIINTGNPLDLAIEGDGYFVLSDGSKNIYSRSGAFALDANSNLVDPATGYFVQRIGSVGEKDGFQTAGNSNITIPYDVATVAKATSTVSVAGNLSADSKYDTVRTNVLQSDISFTTNGGIAATSSSRVDTLDQFSGTAGTDGKLLVTGIKPDGTEVTDNAGLTIDGGITLGDVLAYIETKLGDVTASISNGRIAITDNVSGYSRSDIKLGYKASTNGNNDALELPGYFEITTVGGQEVKNINVTVYDSQGGSHDLSGSFVRTNSANTWDMVLNSITGDVDTIEITGDSNRRIRGIEFDESDGSFSGLNSTTGDRPQFSVTFAHDKSSPQTIAIDMGPPGQFNGLTQFPGNSTAVVREQDGYEAGRLLTVSVDNEGTVIGAFSNGIKKNIATLQMALFQNTSGLENAAGGYLIPSGNFGKAIPAQALTGGAGSIHGGALEKSNADVASEFVNMIQAQKSFQANARTIRSASDILRELTSLMR